MNKRQPSVMGHNFSQIPNVEIPRSSFNRSHGLKTTFNGGLLIPIFVDEALPGDTFNVKMTAFARMATPIHPVMDNLHLETFFFAVPNRLIWENWEKFNGQQDNPGDSTDYTIPTIQATTFQEGSMGDYLGMPINVDNLTPNSLHFRAYNLIWNEWFRDQNLQDSANLTTGDGPTAAGNYPIRRRGKRHDYFTSCLPWPQKGDAVTLPLGTTAPIESEFLYGGTGEPIFYNDRAGTIHNLQQVGNGQEIISSAPGAAGVPANLAWNDTQLVANLTEATAATINDIRQAFQIQRLLEKDARGGTRYTEIVRAHFGVTSPDARLQRPEYLGGGYSPVNINPVAQTSSTDATTPQGNLSAVGTASVDGHGFTKSFTEHCVLIGLVSVRADLTYQQGLNRMWNRQTRYDFYWPSLSMLGEQEVLNKEIYAQGTSADDDVFGYQERYAEYRYKPSQITGKFRSQNSQSLDAWHLSQDFDSLPVLNSAFIEDVPPIDRVIAVPSEPHFLFDAYFDMTCARPMPLFGVPGMIDHF